MSETDVFVGIDVAKATLYRHFPSKDHLVAAYLEDRHQRVMTGFALLAEAHPLPRDRLAAIFDQLHDKAAGPEFRGCAFALAVAEHGGSDQVVTLARQHKAAVADTFTGILAEGGAAAAQAQAATHHLSLLYDGALALIAIRRDPAIALGARSTALAAFDTATFAKADRP